MSHSWTHSWCSDPARDEAVRMAEDNRPGPLPTLEEAIAAVTNRRPVDAGGGGNVTGGLRTERVKLEITHDLDAPLGEWIVQVIDESLGFNETVRVVDNTAERITQALTADRFASAVAEADRLRARVAELESAPAASGAAGTGWLTGNERLAVSGAILILDQHGPTNIGRSLNALLARSSPPKVVRPGRWKAVEQGHPERSWQPFTDQVTANRDAEWLAALAAAGVTVKEVAK